MFMRKRIVRSLVGVALVAAMLFGATVAVAAEGDGARDASPVAVREHRPPGKFAKWVFANTMEILDVNRGEIVSTLAHGDTLAHLAAEQGSSGEALAAALLTKVETRVDEAVAAGEISEERAELIVERMATAIDKAVFEPHHPGERIRERIRRHRHGVRRLLWHTTIEFLEVNRGEIISTFAHGDTLADLAVEQGSSGEALVEELVDALDVRLAQAVANGDITQEQKMAMLERAEPRIDGVVFSPHHPRRGQTDS